MKRQFAVTVLVLLFLLILSRPVSATVTSYSHGYNWDDGLNTVENTIAVHYLIEDLGYFDGYYSNRNAQNSRSDLGVTALWYANTHGAPGRILCTTNGVDKTTISGKAVPSDVNNFSLQALYEGTTWLNDVKFLMSLSCKTGVIDSVYGDLPGNARVWGVDQALTWQNDIWFPASGWYAREFFEKCYANESTYAAHLYATDYVLFIWDDYQGLDSVRVSGNWYTHYLKPAAWGI